MHTPGPWKVGAGRIITTPDGEFYLTYGTDRYGNPKFRDFCKLDRITEHVADMGNLQDETGRTPRQLADLNKELLEALKELVELPKRFDITGIAYITAIANAEEKARKAIAKAEGRA